MRTKADIARVEQLQAEVKQAGLDPKDYKYDNNAQNAYRVERTGYGDFAYILISHKDRCLCREIKVDLEDFYVLRLFSYRWCHSSSNMTKSYPHTTVCDETGRKKNQYLHSLIMRGIVMSSKKVIDHNDGDHYNASKSNLNIVTTAQNNQNRHSVPPYKRRKVSHKDKYVNLGHFN